MPPTGPPAAVIEPTDPWVSATLAVARVAMDAGLVLIVGLLIVAVALRNDRGLMSDGARALLRRSRAVAAVTALATAVYAAATAADVMAVGLGDVARNPRLLESLLAQTSLGRALLWQIGLLLAFGLLCRFITRVTQALLAIPLLLAVIVARASTGHSGNSAWHMAAIEAWAIHIAALCVWMGAVVVLAIPRLAAGAAAQAGVFARLAPVLRVCAAAVVLSGVASAAVRLSTASDLTHSRYGLLLCAKAVASALLLWLLLRVVAKQDGATSRGRWLTAQVGTLGATTVLAVALSRTAPPLDPDAAVGDFSPLRVALGFPPPPAPSATHLLVTQWRPDVLWMFLAFGAVALYLRAAATLRRRGDDWSRARGASWLAGWAVITYATSGPLGTYGHILFSAHMAQHLLLVMVAPLLLVGGAPVTLALRTLPASREHTGAREWLLALLHSRYLRVVSHPLVSFLGFIGGFFALYFSGLFELLMRSHAGHLLMQAHFLASGYLFFMVVVGTDPAPRALPAPARAAMALLAAPFHAIFSVIVMQGTAVLAGGYFTPLAREYGIDPLRDQYAGSSLGWAFGEVPMVIAIVIAVRQWVRADAREAARFDRWDDEQRAKQERASAAE